MRVELDIHYMESSYHGFFIGPVASHDAIDDAARELGVSRLTSLHSAGGAWAMLDLERFVEPLARRLETWIWEVELRNDLDADSRLEETHSGWIRGRRWRATERDFLLRVDDELHEEGFVRGGVMEEVAFEYVRWYASVESEAEPVARSGPSTPMGPLRRRGSPEPEGAHALAARLIDHLIDSHELEVVNHHAHKTLIEPVAACLAGSPAAAAARIALALEDADEVIDLYADDATIETFLRERS